MHNIPYGRFRCRHFRIIRISVLFPLLYGSGLTGKRVGISWLGLLLLLLMYYGCHVVVNFEIKIIRRRCCYGVILVWRDMDYELLY